MELKCVLTVNHLGLAEFKAESEDYMRTLHGEDCTPELLERATAHLEALARRSITVDVTFA